MQPTYIPWLGYFDLIDQVDIFVFLDIVQLVRRSWQVRNRIKTKQGELYLTIPVKKTKSRNDTILYESFIDDDQPWRQKHLKSIITAYSKAHFFKEVYPVIEDIIQNDQIVLSKFTVKLIKTICQKMGIDKEFIETSNLQNIHGRKDTLLVNICKAENCDEYISPRGSAVYIERESPSGEFTENKIHLYYHDYEHPHYSQLHGEFIPHMSIIDLLFNHGFNESLQIIRKGRNNRVI